MKIIKWLENNILFVITLFLLAFIPLYPKLPLLDIKHTWVYIRAEDFVVLFTLLIWSILLFRKKITLKSPLTMPILLFWLAGAIATIHGVLLIFPTLANVFPNVAFLSFVRRIEYLSVFFVAFAGMKDKRYLSYVIAVIAITLFFVSAYGIGQRYLGFPAYLTMNEEFAKGEAIRLSSLSRVPSTFAGHYDLAAYLVLVIPILTSLLFGIRKWLVRGIFLVLIALGFYLMFMTVSRVSFFVLFISLGIVLLFQKKKIVLFSLPVIAVITFFFLSFSPAIVDRFSNTIEEIDVLVDAETGQPIAHAKEVPAEYFKEKIIIHDYNLGTTGIEGTAIFAEEKNLFASSSALLTGSVAPSTPKFIVPYYELPPKVTLLVPANTSTGENLPQGTGYINLSLSPVRKKTGEYFYERKKEETDAAYSADVVIIHGNYIVKRAAAYDLSFTTRFQGEWPHAVKAFMRNIFFGSGYGSISLAIDNNYLRILGEVGLLGAAAFFAIFLSVGMYIRKTLPQADSPMVRSFILGFGAGVVGLALNAVFIDVFEASKVAFVLWLLTGVTVGVLHAYQRGHVEQFKEFKHAISSPLAIITYLGIAVFFLFSPMISNYFVGDDFTWFRWAAEGGNVLRYFTQSDGFFYRPGTKVYFAGMFSIFWLNQAVYHTVSFILHFVVSSLVFLLAKKILRSYAFAVLTGFLFLIASGYAEAIFWISSTGYLFTAAFALSSLLLFILWEERKNIMYFIGSLLFMSFGLLFHELGIVTPLLLVLYTVTQNDTASPIKTITRMLKSKLHVILLFVPVFLYGIMRVLANSHWSGGDYSYNVVKLPFNFIGNSLGYLMISILGSISMPFYQIFRTVLRDELVYAFLGALIIAGILVFIYRFLSSRLKKDDKRILTFGFGFFFIALLPFLGLGNITSRYSYLATVGTAMLISFVLQKLFTNLRDQGKEIAMSSIGVITTLFILLHLMQIQQIHSDWETAGSKAERFLVAVDEVYDDYWATEKMTFNFVNVPIKNGEAWIFPVGLKDALWFSFRNPDITVNQYSSVKDALRDADGSRNKKVFEFDDSGRLIERREKMPIL